MGRGILKTIEALELIKSGQVCVFYREEQTCFKNKNIPIILKN